MPYPAFHDIEIAKNHAVQHLDSHSTAEGQPPHEIGRSCRYISPAAAGRS